MAVLSPSLQVTSEFADDDARRAAARERFADFGARASICALFVFFATQIGGEFARTGHVTGLLLLVSELLVVLLTVVRRPAMVVDRAMSTRLVAAVSMVGIYFIRPVGTPLVSDLATATVSGAGLLAIIAAKLTLGRSFGLMPANRGIVSRGIYRVVRHPIYAGYLVTHAAFLAAHPTLWNAMLARDERRGAARARGVRGAHAGARSGVRHLHAAGALARPAGLLLSEIASSDAHGHDVPAVRDRPAVPGNRDRGLPDARSERHLLAAACRSGDGGIRPCDAARRRSPTQCAAASGRTTSGCRKFSSTGCGGSEGCPRWRLRRLDGTPRLGPRLACDDRPSSLARCADSPGPDSVGEALVGPAAGDQSSRCSRPCSSW